MAEPTTRSTGRPEPARITLPRSPSSVAEAEGLRDGLRHVRGVRYGFERDEVHTVVKAFRLGGGRVEREAGLPHPAWPGERDEALALEQRIDAGHFALTPDEAGQCRGESRRSRRER